MPEDPAGSLTKLLHISLLQLHLDVSCSPCHSQEVFTTPFPWGPSLSDSESPCDLVTSNGGRVTPIWQAECPDVMEDSADMNIWETAFQAWPIHADHNAPFPDLANLMGLPQDLAPPLSPCVSHLQLLDIRPALTCRVVVTAILVS